MIDTLHPVGWYATWGEDMPDAVAATLSMSCLATRMCCGREVAVSGPARYPTQFCIDPATNYIPRTRNRWILVFRWRCMRYEHHHGEWWESTDDPGPT